jgi:hypothetical protein
MGQGERIGWVDDDAVYLVTGLVFAAAQRMAKELGTPITVGTRTLFVRMRERGLLARVEGGKKAFTARTVIAGQQHRTLVLWKKEIAPVSPKPS